MGGVEDRRLARRHPVCVLAYIESDFGTRQRAIVRNVSSSGAFLATRHQLWVGSTISLEFCFGSEASGTHRATAVIVRCESDLEGTWPIGAGIEFGEPLGCEAELIRLGGLQAAAAAGQLAN